MLEVLKGLNIADPKLLIPIIICIIAVLIVVKLVKSLIKIAVIGAVIVLAISVYMNLPSFKVDGSVATLKISGQEHRIDARDVKIESENKDGKTKVYLVSGTTKIELPFSREYAEKFILDKITKSK